MLQLPPDFDVTAFYSDLYALSAPFAAILFTISAYVIVRRIINKV